MIKFDDFEGKLVKRGLDLNYPVALSAVIFNGYLGEMNKKNMSLDYDATEYLFNDIFSRLFWLLEQRSTASSCDISVPEALAAFMGYVRVLSCAQLDCFGMDVPEASGKPIIYGIKEDILAKTNYLFNIRNSEEIKELIIKNYKAVVFSDELLHYDLNVFVINSLNDIAANAFCNLIINGI